MTTRVLHYGVTLGCFTSARVKVTTRVVHYGVTLGCYTRVLYYGVILVCYTGDTFGCYYRLVIHSYSVFPPYLGMWSFQCYNRVQI